VERRLVVGTRAHDRPVKRLAPTRLEKLRAVGINGLELVSLTFASWNQIGGWLLQLDSLREAACLPRDWATEIP
jgi:hypothetical protein